MSPLPADGLFGFFVRRARTRDDTTPPEVVCGGGRACAGVTVTSLTGSGVVQNLQCPPATPVGGLEVLARVLVVQASAHGMMALAHPRHA